MSASPAGHPHAEETTTDTNSKDDAEDPVWDPVAQIYVGGRVPDPDGSVARVLQANAGALPIFGYGSLCWKPGGILADARVKAALAQALGYRRCWCQKSTDHRGTPAFPGIVCTLLKDAEVQALWPASDEVRSMTAETTRTQGVLYTVPPVLVDDCLAELDFREKGGYKREVIHVRLADGTSQEAVLYRGTPDNPALWPRVLKDLSYAAAVLTAAHGPSGPNADYLHNLYDFLQAPPGDFNRGKDSATSTTNQLAQEADNDDTVRLTRLVDYYRKEGFQFFFCYGGGSNQHNQLSLQHYSRHLIRDEEAHVVTEVLLAATAGLINEREVPMEMPAAVLAGGGHSALVTTQGRLFLFGWNDASQCGALYEDTNATEATTTTRGQPPPMGWEFPYRVGTVATCALGFAHTLIGDASGRLWAFGDNAKGQVTGKASKEPIRTPVLVTAVENKVVVAVAAGLFHSAAVTDEGDVVEWGASSRQWLPAASTTSRPLAGVACGRKHTLTWNVDGQIWSWGVDAKNKYGQLGRTGEADVPALVDVPWSPETHCIVDIQCGWSHCVALVQDMTTQERVLYGWGRNDKGQLGLDPAVHKTIPLPVPLPLSHVQSFSCGSEFTMAVQGGDESVWACGWNEHGNLGVGTSEEDFLTTWHAVTTGRLAQPPGTSAEDTYPVQLAAGGAHFLAARVGPLTLTVT